MLRKYALSPARNGGPQCRVSSPVFGCSILITRAPRSASNIVQYGPESTRVRSRTVMSSKGPMSPELYWPFQEKTVTVNANVALDRSMTLVAPDLARIPGGEFLMGAADGQPDERPVHRVRVSEFFVGRFLVTNDEYARFVRATGHRAPDVRSLPIFAAGEREAAFKELAAPYVWENGEPPAGRGNHPVVLITYDDAVAYCGWLSVALQRLFRLPTEAEWEKAARGGVEANKYPWGKEIDPS